MVPRWGDTGISKRFHAHSEHRSTALASGSMGAPRLAATRWFRGGADVLGRPEPLRRGAVHVGRPPPHVADRRRLRVGLRADHYRCDRHHRHRRPTAVHPVVPPAAAVAWGDGDHRAGGRYPAHARYRRYAALPSGNAGPHEGYQTHSTHHRNRKGALVYLSWTDGALCPSLLACGHGRLRRRCTQLLHRFHRRFLNS